ncbi:MAG: methionine biosynthesis protein MetW [Planctomycetaceae bacterium]
MTDEIIMEQIASGSRVIDLGCGDGRLLARLRDEHNCSGQGIELDHGQMLSAIARGIPIINGDLDQGLSDIPNDTFDCAVLSQTLQQVRHPKELLLEMMRIASRALVIVPNFGYWRVRLQVIRFGRTPITEILPYEWYNTPNLHFMSMHDFRALAEHLNIRILQERPIINGRAVDRAWAANLRADSALYVLERRPLKASA